MEEEYLPSQDLQKTFQKWFGDSVPEDSPSHSEAYRSLIDPVQTNVLYPAEVYRPYYTTPRINKYDLQALPELFGYGFKGAVTLGVVAGFFILLMNINYVRWDRNLPSQFFVIAIAALVGFWGGLFGGAINKVRERYSYKNRL